MGTSAVIPAPPAGFHLEDDIPPPPAGFHLESDVPPPPAGFTLESHGPPDAFANAAQSNKTMVPPELTNPPQQTTGYMGIPYNPTDTLDVPAIARGTVRNLKNLATAAAPVMQDEATLAAAPMTGYTPNAAVNGKPNPVAPFPTKEQTDAIGTAANTPLVPLSEGFQPGTLSHGLAAGLEGLTTPTNLATVAVAGPLNQAANAARYGYESVALKALNTGLHAVFTGQMGIASAKNMAAAYDAYQRGDLQGVADNLGAGTVEGLFAVLGIKHGAEQFKDIGKVKIPNATETETPTAQQGPYKMEPKGLEAPPGLLEPPEAPPPNQVRRPGPETPNAPTASLPTKPESPATLAIQMEQLGTGTRKAVMFPGGENLPDTFPPNSAITHDPYGNVYVYRQDKTDASKILQAAKQNKLPEILGADNGGYGAPDKSALPPDAPVMVVRSADGTEVHAAAFSPETAATARAAAEQLLPPGGAIAIEPAHILVGQRNDNATHLGIPQEPGPSLESQPASGAVAPAGPQLGPQRGLSDQSGGAPGSLEANQLPGAQSTDVGGPLNAPDRTVTTQYHGTSAPITELRNELYSNQNIYGQGLYTTDDLTTAQGYAKKGRGNTPTIYRVTEKRPQRLLDMDQPLTPDILSLLHQLPFVPHILEQDKPKTLTALYDAMRDSGTQERLSTHDLQEYFDGIAYQLQRAGYTGLTHIGGRLTNRKPHKVRIYFTPEQDVAITPHTNDTAAPKPATVTLGSLGGPLNAPDRTVATPERYHGTSKPISRLNPATYSADNIYGRGLYTTDSLPTAIGYTRKGGKPHTPSLYRVVENSPARLLDMDQPFTGHLLHILRQQRSPYIDSFLDLSEDAPTTLTQLYDAMRETSPMDDNGYDEDPRYLMDGVAHALQKQGYTGLTHIGGVLTHHPAHRVNIYFNPQKDLTLTSIKIPTSLRPIDEHKPATQADATVTLGSLGGAMQPAAEYAGKVGKDFYEREVKPQAEAAVQGSRNTVAAMVHFLAPRAGVAPEHLKGLMEMKGGREAAAYVLSRKLDKYAKITRKLSKAQQIQFIDNHKLGKKQATQDLQDLSDIIKQVGDLDYQEIQKYSPTTPYLENHYRVLWKILPSSEGKTKTKGFLGNAKRPLQGTTGMLKQHTLADMSEGIARGGVPWSYDPVEMFKAAHADAQKYITVQKLLADWKQNGTRVYVKKGGSPPVDYDKVSARLFQVYFKVPQGLVHAGDWWVAKGPARLLNNYLSHDYIREADLGKFFLALKTATTSVELSLSPFHALFISGEAWGSQIGIGFRKVWNIGAQNMRKGVLTFDPAKFAEGVKAAAEGTADIATAPRAIVQMSSLGRQARKAFGNYDEYINTPEGRLWLAKHPAVPEGVRMFFDSGGVIGQNHDLKMNAINGFIKAVQDRSAPSWWISAGIRSPAAFMQYIMTPLFDHYIPNLKLGFFLQEFALAQKEQSGRIASGETTPLAIGIKTLDSIENRFGEMNFSNLWWDNTFKTALQIAFRSITWKLGTVRAMGGGITGQLLELRRAIRMKEFPLLHPSMGWLIGTALMGTIFGNIMFRLATGKWPTSIKDVLHPLVDERNKLRVALPTYLESAWRAAHNPVGFVTGAVTGDFGLVMDLWNNQDFHHNEVWAPDDPLPQKTLDGLQHLVPLPFSISNYRQNAAVGGNAAARWLPALGFPIAPKYIDQSPAERLAQQYSMGHREIGSRTTKAAQRSQEETKIQGIIRHGGDPDKEIEAAERAGQIGAKDIRKLFKDSETSDLKRHVNGLSLQEQLNVYDTATPQEREDIETEVVKKVTSSLNKPWFWSPHAIKLSRQYFQIEPNQPDSDFGTPPGIE